MSDELELMRAELKEVRAEMRKKDAETKAKLEAVHAQVRCLKVKVELSNIQAFLTTLLGERHTKKKKGAGTASFASSDARYSPRGSRGSSAPGSPKAFTELASGPADDENFVNAELFTTALITEDWGKDTHDYFMVAAHMLQRCFMSHVAHSRDFKQLNLTLDGHGELDRNVVRMSKCFEEPMDRFDFTFVPTEGEYHVWTIKVFSPDVEIRTTTLNTGFGKKLWDLRAPTEHHRGIPSQHGRFRLFSLGDFDGKKVRFDEGVSMRSLVLQSLMAHHFHDRVNGDLLDIFREWAQTRPTGSAPGSGALVERWFDAQTTGNLDPLVKECGTDLTAKAAHPRFFGCLKQLADWRVVLAVGAAAIVFLRRLPFTCGYFEVPKEGVHAAAATDMHEAATAAAATSVHGAHAAAP